MTQTVTFNIAGLLIQKLTAVEKKEHNIDCQSTPTIIFQHFWDIVSTAAPLSLQVVVELFPGQNLSVAPFRDIVMCLLLSLLKIYLQIKKEYCLR